MSGVSLPGGISTGPVKFAGAGIDAGSVFGGGGGGGIVLTVGEGLQGEVGFGVSPPRLSNFGAVVPNTYEGETIIELFVDFTSNGLQLRFAASGQPGGAPQLNVSIEGDVNAPVTLTYALGYYSQGAGNIALRTYLLGQSGNDLSVTIAPP